MSQSISTAISLIKADMQHRCEYERKVLNALQVIKFLFNPAVFSAVLYRLQMFFYLNELGFIGVFFKLINSIFLTVDIDSKTQIGGGFFIMHASHICIGANVVIGKNCIMAHQNSVCPSPFFLKGITHSSTGPTLGDDVILGGGATVSGEIVLGSNVQVSMNAAVDNSFPDNAVLFGVPAKNIAKKVSPIRTDNLETLIA